VIGLGCRRFNTLTGLGLVVEVPAVDKWSDLIPVGVFTRSWRMPGLESGLEIERMG